MTRLSFNELRQLVIDNVPNITFRDVEKYGKTTSREAIIKCLLAFGIDHAGLVLDIIEPPKEAKPGTLAYIQCEVGMMLGLNNPMMGSVNDELIDNRLDRSKVGNGIVAITLKGLTGKKYWEYAYGVCTKILGLTVEVIEVVEVAEVVATAEVIEIVEIVEIVEVVEVVEVVATTEVIEIVEIVEIVEVVEVVVTTEVIEINQDEQAFAEIDNLISDYNFKGCDVNACSKKPYTIAIATSTRVITPLVIRRIGVLSPAHLKRCTSQNIGVFTDKI